MRRRASKHDQFKVVIVGDKGVGKSCLVMRYFLKKFDPSKSRTTIDACYHLKTWSHGEKNYVMELWDTSGEERFRSICPMYYRKAVAAVVCFDLTGSEKKIVENLNYWIQSLHAVEPLCKIYFCGTKSDLDVNGLKIMTFLTSAERLVKEHNARIYITSSKTGGDIEKLFADIFYDYVHNTKPDKNDFSSTLKLETGQERRIYCINCWLM